MGTTLDLDRYLRIPRLGELDVAPDGSRLVFSCARLGRDGTRFTRDLHALRPDGGAAPERLTVGDPNDHGARFRADGSVLFLSARPDPEPAAEDGEEAPAKDGALPSQLWLLPPSGEPRPLTHRAGDVSRFAAARRGAALLFRASVHPGTEDLAADRLAERARRKAGSSELLFDALPIRFWDRFYGPRYEHLFLAASPEELDRARDLTPGATIEFDDLGFDLSPDGRLAVASERGRDAEGRFHENLRLWDTADGSSRLLTRGTDSWLEPRFSPDGRALAALFHENPPGRHGRQWLALVPLDGGGEPRPLTRELDLWPEAPTWAADGSALYFTADERGHHPVFRVSLADGAVTRLTAAGSYADLVAAPDGRALYAIGARFDRPPEVVALDPARADQEPRRLTRLTAPALEGVAMSAAESLTSKGKDGREVHSWLLRPRGEPPPAGWPLLLWVHGGPLGAWGDGWHWRWNPQLFAARGWAVLLVNPRISTGYGQAFIEEGFARWGGEPFDDLMAAVDAAVTRPGIDPARTAAMGGSYGGYMANWIAGHTARFRCIVSHAGLWHLWGFHGTTDLGPEWEREFGGDPYRHPEIYERWSPHHGLKDIRTPMLVVHGEKDYRVPVSEAFQLFTALQRLGVPSRLLYYPDENHWILRPPNIRTWHEAIWAWLGRWLG